MGKKEEGSNTAQQVYIMHKDYAWVPAQVKEMKGDIVTVRVPQYEEEALIMSDGGKTAKSWKEEDVKVKTYPGKSLPMQNVDKDGQLTVLDDMVDLPYLHEAAILYNIKARHCLAKPYTRTGDIIIAVNPYQWLTHLYTPAEQTRYANTLVWEAVQEDNRKLVEPHVYETSSLCYKGLALDEMNQSILVSGESGAGKTETVKICMNHMAAVQVGMGKDAETGENPVVQRVVDSNPLLEAFGNAKTRRNDNSSRFGKYIQLQFDRTPLEPGSRGVPHCKLAGSKCEVYLLEKTRITEHDSSERTYHVFYQVVGCKEADKLKIWPGLKGSTNETFKYVGYTDTTMYEGKADGDHYYSTCEGLAKVGITEENGKLMMLYRAITTVLQLGQLTFGPKGGDAESSCCTSAKDLNGLADLMGLSANDIELAITERTMITRGETFKVPLKPDAAKDNADAYGKEIYSKLFLWLVREINAATCAEENYAGNRNQTFGSIGLLDIFGFESFPINGFEQLCINYANEKLQQKFTRDIFATVQEEYKFEGIDLDDIKYDDNSDVLDLIEGRTGLLAMLNEECVRPKGSDKDFVHKAKEGNKKSACLIADRLLGPLDFGIHHYAGKVIYFAQGFLARNLDSLGEDLKKVSLLCNNEIISKHLTNEKMSWSEVDAAPPAGGAKRGKSNIASDSLWTKFRTQLNSLMKNLGLTQSRYIRCVKPNTVKKPLVMFHMTTIDQLRCAGVVAAVTISRSAFPNRLDHRACYERFKVLIVTKGEKSAGPDEKIDHKAQIIKMCDRVLAPLEKDGKKPYVTGKTRIYFRMGVLEYMEGERQKGWDVWALDVQRAIRGHIVRMKNSSRKMTAKAPCVTKIASWYRMIVAMRKLKKLKKDKKAKGKQKKKQFKAVIKIQSVCRMHLVKPRFKAMVKEHREKFALKNHLEELEKKLQEAEKAREKEVEEARLKAEAEMEEHKKKMKAELANDKEKQKKFAQQQSLIEESGKIIEYLRKENMKLRTQNDTMRKDFKALKENNQRLMEANASASQSFNALNDHAKGLNATNAKLIKNVEAYKQQLEKLKDDLKQRQQYYLAEAEARLTYQKCMATIVGSIQDKCRDAQLVEDVVIMALECEAEAKAARSSLESAAKKAAAAKSGASTPAPSVAKTETSADSDSDDD